MATAPVNLGLIGVGPAWESRFRPTFAKVNSRLRVVAVYDAVLSRADQAAREIGARVVTGISALANRPDIHGLLWLDAGWSGTATLRLLSSQLKPVLMSARRAAPWPTLKEFREVSSSNGRTLVPAFPRRFTPASNRLQELLATQLGRPWRVEISLPPGQDGLPFATAADCMAGTAAPDDLWLEWVDWCLYLLRAAPQQVTRRDDGQGLHLEFANPTKSSSFGGPWTADISIVAAMATAANPTLNHVRVECERGTANLLGPTTIEWTTDAGTQPETLASERSELEVLLDQFCRRIVGGLIPVPDLTDFCQAWDVLESS